MEFKGTKGGWEFDNLDVYFENKDGLEFIEGNVICCAPSDLKQSMKKWEANAKLIACAPEMLEFIQHCIDNDCFKYGNEEDAKKLIKKATE